MCGIAGIYSNRGIDRDTLERMTDVLEHRGPDDRGFYSDKFVGLGHRRLSIIDIEGGRQPMSDDSGRFILVYNGEIYNYRELQRELASKGFRFHTHSDTEVLLNACIHWQERAPEHLNGMFAYGFYDRQESRLILARDRLGIKPLFYTQLQDAFIFASEIKSLLEYPGLEREPNIDAIAFYLSHYQTVFGNETLFRGIENLEPGCSLTIEPGKIAKRRYWQLPIVPESEKRDKGEGYYIEGVRSHLTSALKRHLISDVPLGAYLSGGIDSAILVGLMAENSSHQLKTFAIGFEAEGFNEFQFSDMVASGWGTDHTQIVMEEDDYFQNLSELIRFKDAPLSVPNEVPLYIMSKILKNSITVVISGEGSDELFGGYGGILRSPIDYLRSLPDSNVPKNERKLLEKALVKLYGRSEFSGEIDHFLAVYSWMKQPELEMIFCKDIIDKHRSFSSCKSYWQNQFNRIKDLDLYNKYLYLMETAHLPTLLGRLDTTTMAASVEGRVPFTDTELLDFVTRIPFKYKLRWNSPMYESMCARLHSFEIAETLDTTKYILKRSFVDKVPPEVLFRKKYSFPVPLQNWYGNGLLNNLLESAEAELPFFLDKSGIMKWLSSVADADKPLKSWMLLNLIKWYNKYFISKSESVSTKRIAAAG